jgi:CheY-like chemotaxis protein
VFWNLLSNAAKFAPAGGKIAVRLDRLTGAGGEDLARLRVTDSGAGIDPKFLPYVFDRFRQADSSSTRSHGGLGIGLTIVRHIVELHGGTVRADSTGEGQGSTFTVTLPVSVAPAEPAEPEWPAADASGEAAPQDAGAPDLEGLQVLIVDDEADARDILAQIVRRAGAQVATAGSSKEGLELLRRERPDLLVSDIAMPDEDGYAFIRQVRSLTADTGGQTAAVAVTAYARDDDRRRALAAGFQAHLAKPVEPADLLNVLSELASTAPGRTTTRLKLRYG